MPQMFFPLGSILDDAGAIVAGATVTIASVKDPATDANIASHGATVALSSDGLRCGVLYDPTTKGDAWVTLSVSKAGSTFNGSNASPVILAASDAQTIASLPTLSEIEAAVPGVITRSGPHSITALDSGIDGTVGLFVGDRYSLTIKATIGSDPPGGTGATWQASTTDEATGAAIVTDAAMTEISEEIGYFAYALAAGDTTSARRVRLTVKRTLGSDVRIFGPLVLNVRDR